MDPFSLALGTTEILTRAAKILSTITQWKSDPEVATAYSRIQWSMMLLKLFVPYEHGSFKFKLDLDAQVEVAEQLAEASTEMRNIENALSKISMWAELKSNSFLQKMKKEFILADLVRNADRVDRLAKFLQDVHQTLALQRLGNQIAILLERSDLFPRETWRAVHSIEERLADGGHEEEEMVRTRDELDNEFPEMPPEERNNRIEDIRTILRSVSNGRPLNRDPMCFPFIIPCKDSDDVEVRVKLDTGSRPNWISKKVLDKAGSSYDAVEDLGLFIGASKNPLPFKPLGKACVTWFSENQALTTESTFLVHDDSLPFDVILGSKWILEDLSFQEFIEPVLPMRHIITQDELKEVEAHAIEYGIENDKLIQLQRMQKSREREQRRQSKAESRATSTMPSVAPTPRTVGSPIPDNGSASLTRVTSMTSIAAQSFATPAQTLQTSNTASQGTVRPEATDSTVTSPSDTTVMNPSLNFQDRL